MPFSPACHEPDYARPDSAAIDFMSTYEVQFTATVTIFMEANDQNEAKEIMRIRCSDLITACDEFEVHAVEVEVPKKLQHKILRP